MKTSKILLVNCSGAIASLNVAIGEKALALYNFVEEVNSVVEPFEKFRNKMIKSLGIEGKTYGECPNEFKEFNEKVNEFLKGEIEINTNFLTDEEFNKAIKPLLAEGNMITAFEIKRIKNLLVEEDQPKDPEEQVEV